MLIRGFYGNVFHVVEKELENQGGFVCLCGALVEKISLERQTVAEWPYSRCWNCRKIQNQRILLSLDQLTPRTKEYRHAKQKA